MRFSLGVVLLFWGSIASVQGAHQCSDVEVVQDGMKPEILTRWDTYRNSLLSRYEVYILPEGTRDSRGGRTVNNLSGNVEIINGRWTARWTSESAGQNNGPDLVNGKSYDVGITKKLGPWKDICPWFTIELEADTRPHFTEDGSLYDRIWIEGEAVTGQAGRLPTAIEGNEPLIYSFPKPLPEGISYDSENHRLLGTPTKVGAYKVRVKVADSDSHTGPTDEDEIEFIVIVEEDTAPVLDAVDDQVYTSGRTIPPLQLPLAAGGNAPVTHVLSPAAWNGLSYDSQTRQLTGTPLLKGEQYFVYTATDRNGDEAKESFTVTVEKDTVPRLAEVADQRYTKGWTIPPLQLPLAVGGNAPVVQTLSPAAWNGLSYDRQTRQLTGTPTERDEQIFTYTATDRNGDYTAITFAVQVKFQPPVATSLPDIYLMAGGASHDVDVTAAFSGEGLRYDVEFSAPSIAVIEKLHDGHYRIRPREEGQAAVTVKASNESGAAMTSFTIFVRTSPAEKQALKLGLAAQARALLNSSGKLVDSRLRNSARGAQLPLTGSRVSAQLYSLLEACETDHALGAAAETPSDCVLWGRSFATTWGRQDGNGSGQWTVWSAGDIQKFAGRENAHHYDGDWRSLYLGMDTTLNADWLVGLAVSAGEGKTTWDADLLSGKMRSDLAMLFPYARGVLGEGIEIWGLAGFGSGDIKHRRDHLDGVLDTGRLSSALGLLGMRYEIWGGPGGSLSIVGDAGRSRLGVKNGNRSLAGLKASVHQVRMGVESVCDVNDSWSWRVRLGGRYDGGDGETGLGAEVLGGVRYVRDRFEASAQGTAIVVNEGASSDYKDQSLSVTLILHPEQDGTGLSWSFTPGWGDGAAEHALEAYGTSVLDRGAWQDQRMGIWESLTEAPSKPQWHLKGELSYGFRLPGKMLLVPHLVYQNDGFDTDIFFGVKLIYGVVP